MLRIILWMVYPYMVIAIVMMGIVWRYDALQPGMIEDEESPNVNNLNKWIVLLMFLLWLSTGLSILVINHFSKDSVKLYLWFAGFVRLHPNLEIIKNISLLSQFHLLILFTFFLVLPFTNILMQIQKLYKVFKRHII